MPIPLSAGGHGTNSYAVNLGDQVISVNGFQRLRGPFGGSATYSSPTSSSSNFKNDRFDHRWNKQYVNVSERTAHKENNLNNGVFVTATGGELISRYSRMYPTFSPVRAVAWQL